MENRQTDGCYVCLNDNDNNFLILVFSLLFGVGIIFPQKELLTYFYRKFFMLYKILNIVLSH